MTRKTFCLTLTTLLGVFCSAVVSAQTYNFTYGQHFPNGLAGVQYIYGSDGTWKHMTNVTYTYNFYATYDQVVLGKHKQVAVPQSHPQNQSYLESNANGTNDDVCLDANGHLLLDTTHSGSVNVADGGYAFCQHDGKGPQGQTVTNPFTLFWFDDNWLARYMSIAYGQTQPNGLSTYNDFTRWRIIGGDTSYWVPYNDTNTAHYDTPSLDGLYYLKSGNPTKAYSNWTTMISNSGATYNSSTQEYDYPNVGSAYYVGLMRILVENLLDTSGFTTAQYSTMLQHSVSLRSLIMTAQGVNSSGTLIGWSELPGQSDYSTSLIGTETTAAEVLGLGADAKYVYEAGQSPLYSTPNNYFQRSYHVYSAVTGSSTPGYMTYGPYTNVPTGTYNVEFYLRAPSPTGTVATLDIHDANSNTVLASQSVTSSMFTSGNVWTKITVPITVSNASNSLEYRVYWNGTCNMDVAYIRVR